MQTKPDKAIIILNRIADYREQCRKNGDFKTADQIRDLFLKVGVTFVDTKLNLTKE